MATTRAQALSLWIKTGMVVLPTGTPMALLTILTPPIIGNILQQLQAMEIISACMVDRVVSDCNLDCHMTGQLATIITYPGLLFTQTGSSISLFPYIPAKSASRKQSIIKSVSEGLMKIPYQK